MRLKSYFAGTVESAICLARQEMGGDAMLVNSRRTLPESRHLGAYEVVFAAAQDSGRHLAAAAAQAQTEERSKPQSPTLASEVAEIRRQLTRMSSLVSRSAVRSGLRSTTAVNPALDGFDHTLAANDVDGDLACCMLRNLESLGLAASAAEIGEALRKDIQNRITVSAELSPWSFEPAPGPGAAPARTIAALVGPPGVGKTTMLAKLAMRFGISARRATHIISYDSHRIAAGDQLRSYAAIMGVGFEPLETIGALAQSLKDNTRRDLILIDTPGYSAQDFPLSCDLTKFLSTYPHVDIHLVLSCGAKSSDISRMVDRYSTFAPAKLLFTRLDETDSYGALLNEPVRTGLPVSFLGAGPRIPEDFEPASKDRIAELLLEGREGKAVAAA